MASNEKSGTSSKQSASNRPGKKGGAGNAKSAAKVRAAQAQQRQRVQWTVGIVVLVIAGIAVLVLAKTSQTDNTVGTSTKPTAAPASIVTDLAKVPLKTIVSAHGTRFKGYAQFKDPVAENGTSLTKAGKPEVLYMGAEYCPYCGGERWALTVALSKFGTFSDLKVMQSSEGKIPTLSFLTAKYTSKYVAFTPIELADQNNKPLEKATDAQMKLLTAHGGSYPFISFGGKFIQSGASLDVQALVGKTQTEIAKSLSSPGAVTSAASQVDGAAGAFVKTICSLTKGQPGDVCKSLAAS